MLRWSDESQTIELSVRDLVGRTGDHPSLVVSPAARVRMGLQAHEQAPDDGRAQEVRWRHVEEVLGWRCVLHARVDGLVQHAEGRTLVEEIKSVAVPSSMLPNHPVHESWHKQLGLYLLIAQGMQLPRPTGQLRLISLVDGGHFSLAHQPDPELRDSLRAWLAARVRTRELWLSRREVRRSLHLSFPHALPRDGQERILEAAGNAVHRRDALMVEAPTGLGKTAPALVGALRACFVLDRALFWATARGTQRWIVERSLAAPSFRSANLRSVVIPSRREACANCRDGTCNATAELADLAVLDRSQSPDITLLQSEAARQNCCAWALAVEFAATLADVVVADLNYAFDPDIYLRALFGFGAARSFALILDEAHQLPERARDWASGQLNLATCDAVNLAYPNAEHAPFRLLAAEVRQLIELSGGGTEPTAISGRSLEKLRVIAANMDGLAVVHAGFARPPDDDPWRQLHGAVSKFAAYADHEGEEIVSFAAGGALHLTCRDPAFLLRPRMAAVAGLIAMSATLEPTWYWRERCGIDREHSEALVLRSPFPAENRLVLIARNVSTTMKDRAKEHPRIAALLDAAANEVPGNIAIFFGSFETLEDLSARMRLDQRQRLVQTPGMSAAARSEMAQAMATPRKALLAVLGGVFGESVDLPNGALDAAFIVGPSLAPPDIPSSFQRDYLERRYDDGFGLATVHPGMIRVVQAAGRVVRGPADRGAIILVCRRFQQYEYQKYLPADWTPRATSDSARELRSFFHHSKPLIPRE